MELDGEEVSRFREKPADGDGWINGAFFVLEPGVFEYIDGDATSWERGPMVRLAADRQLGRLSPRLFLAMHGYSARKASCSRNCGPKARRLGKHGSDGMRILVTGHRGYIGSVLVDRLKAAGHDVVGMDSELYEECTFGGEIRRSGIPTIHRDIRELSPADLEGVEAIAHLAGVCNDPLGGSVAGDDLRHQSRGDCTAGANRQDRAASAGLCFLRPAASMAPPDKIGSTNGRSPIRSPLMGHPNGMPSAS